MQITEKAKKYLNDQKLKELTVIEVEMKTCCSTQKVPRVSIGKNYIEGEKVSTQEIDNYKIYFVENAQIYSRSSTIDLKQIGDIKTLIIIS